MISLIGSLEVKLKGELNVEYRRHFVGLLLKVFVCVLTEASPIFVSINSIY